MVIFTLLWDARMSRIKRKYCFISTSNLAGLGGAVASRLTRSSSSPDRAVRVRALAGDIVVFLGKTLYSHSASFHSGV